MIGRTILLALSAFLALPAAGRSAAVPGAARDSMFLIAVPAPLAAEHDEIHDALASAVREPGRLGEAARAVEALMAPHISHEEAFALPPLALLAPLARGESWAEMREILPLTDRLREELPRMIAEHRAIEAALDALTAEARARGRTDIEDLTAEIRRHARTEELILYPAAVLVGDAVELWLGRQAWYPDARR